MQEETICPKLNCQEIYKNYSPQKDVDFMWRTLWQKETRDGQ